MEHHGVVRPVASEAVGPQLLKNEVTFVYELPLLRDVFAKKGGAPHTKRILFSKLKGTQRNSVFLAKASFIPFRQMKCLQSPCTMKMKKVKKRFFKEWRRNITSKKFSG